MLQFPPSNPKEPFNLLTGKGKKKKRYNRLGKDLGILEIG